MRLISNILVFFSSSVSFLNADIGGALDQKETVGHDPTKVQ